MSTLVRYTPQKQQELRSRRQLWERLDEFGWIASRPDEDLGEDFIVHVYLQGRATGVTFHVQEKSVTNLNERRRGDYLVHDFEVKDLKHWETFSLPVVLIVWDIKLREGRWELIDGAISDLDRRRPNWRENKTTVSVHIPWSNTTDDAGLARLKQSIGQRLYPLIAKGREPEVEMGLNFPDTEEGQTARANFEHFLRRGGQFTIDEGKFISEFSLSEWYTYWFGEFDLEKLKVTLEFPTPSRAFPVMVTIISHSGKTISIPSIELKVIKAGLEMATLSNQHQSSPLHFRYTIPKPGEEVFIKLNNLGSDIHTVHNTANFLQAVANGGTLRFTFLSLNNISQDIIVPPQPEKKFNSEYLKLIDKLCLIQTRIEQFLPVPTREIPGKEVREINRLVEIIERGKTIIQDQEMKGEFEDEALKLILNAYQNNEPVKIQASFDGSQVKFLGIEIQTGPGTRWSTGRPKLPITESEKTTVEFVNVEIIDVFPDWFIREAQRLSQLLAEKFEVEAVYLFGSLVWSDVHAPETDIDLAVSGLPVEQYLEAVSFLERESKFPIDLVELNKVSEHLRRRILTEGKLLYEREPVAAFG